MCEGFCKVEVVPSPKFHNQPVAPVEASVNCMVKDVLKAAFGAVVDVGVRVGVGVGVVVVPGVTTARIK